MKLSYSVSLGKLIIALQYDDELARETLFDIVLEDEDAYSVPQNILVTFMDG